MQGANENSAQTILSHVGADDRLLNAEHHRLLIRPDAFHVAVLFQPTLAFLERVSGVLPSGSELTRASTELLDDFVLNVYLPQLEEKSSVLFHSIVTGHDAFLVDPASLKLTREPLLKVTKNVHNWITLSLQTCAGFHTINGADKFTLCHVTCNAFPSRELLSLDTKRDNPILPAM